MTIRFIGKVGFNGKSTFFKAPAPVWVTSSGSLGIFNEGDSVNIQLSATDPTYVIYSVVPGFGALPANLTLSSSGVLSGTLAGIETTTIFNNIKIRAINRYGISSYITVSITVDVTLGLTCDTTTITTDSSDNIASIYAIS
jgi:hypothetical protein